MKQVPLVAETTLIGGARRQMRVLLDPDRAAGLDQQVGFAFTDAPPAGLHIRNSVSVATDGREAENRLVLPYGLLTRILGGVETLGDALASGTVQVTGDLAAVRQALACYEVPGLRG